MTDTPDDDDAPASEALKEARAQAAVKGRTKWVAGAVATGIGSAALVAALLYANRGRKKDDK
jgi:hypothetical protein